MTVRVLVAALLLLAATGTACKGKPKPTVGDAAPIGAAGDAAAAPSVRAGEEPSRAECEAAITNMQKVAPAMVPGDAGDIEDCLKLPRALVLCLQTVKTSAEADACVDHAIGPVPNDGGAPPAEDAAAAAPTAAAAEVPRPTPDKCTKMMKHYKTLAGAGDEASESSMLAACTTQLTAAQVDCVIAATDFQDAQACFESPP